MTQIAGLDTNKYRNIKYYDLVLHIINEYCSIWKRTSVYFPWRADTVEINSIHRQPPSAQLSLIH